MTWILGLLTGPLLDKVLGLTSQIVDWQKKKIDATTEQAKIEADEHIKTLTAQRDVQIAESGSRINALVRLGFALPPMIYMAKLYVWDKTLKFGTTDPLSPMMENVLWTVVGFYFLQWTIGRTVRIFKR
jgi:hypothetical protein